MVRTGALLLLLMLAACGEKERTMSDGIEWELSAGPFGPIKLDIEQGQKVKTQDLKVYGEVRNTRSERVSKVVYTIAYMKNDAPWTGHGFPGEVEVADLLPGENRVVRLTIGHVVGEWGETTRTTVTFKEVIQ